MSSFSEKTGDHLLGSASWASNFCWICLILKHPYSRLLFTFGLIRVNPWFITCHDVIDMFQSTAIVFLEHLFRIVWVLMRTNFFDSQMFMQYLMYASLTNGCLTLTILQYHLAHRTNGFRNNNWPSRNSSWIRHTIDKHWSLMELHRQKLNSVHWCTVVELIHVESFKK